MKEVYEKDNQENNDEKDNREKVTYGIFVFVAIDKSGKPVEIKQQKYWNTEIVKKMADDVGDDGIIELGEYGGEEE